MAANELVAASRRGFALLAPSGGRQTTAVAFAAVRSPPSLLATAFVVSDRRHINIVARLCAALPTVSLDLRFLTNAAEADRSKAPKLLCRALACLRIELGQNRIATSAKQKAERERRSADNSVAADVLHAGAQVWKVVKGPAPDELFHPTPHRSLRSN